MSAILTIPKSIDEVSVVFVKITDTKNYRITTSKREYIPSMTSSGYSITSGLWYFAEFAVIKNGVVFGRHLKPEKGLTIDSLQREIDRRVKNAKKLIK